MKKHVLIPAFLVFLFFNQHLLTAQEDTTGGTFKKGIDIYSSYIWRGTKFGTGAAFQPALSYTSGGFTLGSWGNICTGKEEALEMDLYMSYDFEFGLSLKLSDYYFGGNWGLYDVTHQLEPMINYKKDNLTFGVASMFTPSVAGTDIYVEANYAFKKFDLTIGAGDGAYIGDILYATNKGFGICNISVKSTKEIKISDFKLPFTSTVTLNPYTERFYIAAGLTF